MKLLFENWRQFITEATTVPVEVEPTLPPQDVTVKHPGLYKWLLENKNITLIRYLGKGAFGKVFEIEMPSGQRAAVKAIDRFDEEQADDEVDNYKWIMDNKTNLPPEVAKHLPDVYGVIKEVIIPTDEFGTGDIADIEHSLIFMEFMMPAPPSVIEQLFATGVDSERSPYASKQKEKRILENDDAVVRIVKDAFEYASSWIRMLDMPAQRISGPLRQKYIEELAVKAVGGFFKGENPGYPPDAGEKPDFYSDENTTDEMRRLMDTIFQFLHNTYKNYPNYQDWYLARSAMSISESIFYSIRRHVIPTTYGNQPGSFHGPAEKEIQVCFPEIEGIMKAMDYFYAEDFQPSDVHYGNVMIRPRTNELVITDVGNFKGERGEGYR